jgi:CelD/BcsL family acetyltransferase involved in cellulose biosynthesis
VAFDPNFLAPAAAALHVAVEPLAVRGRDGELLGWMPLTSARLGHVARALRVWVHDFGPLGTPVIDAAQRSEVVAALVDTALERAGDNAALVFPYLPEDSAVAPLIEAAARSAGRSIARIDRHARAVLDRSHTDLRSLLPRKRRKEYARQMRRLADEGPVVVEHAVAPAEIAKRFDEFVALEASGWKGRRGTAMANEPEIVAFCRDAVDALARHGNASALTLRVGDRPAAMLLCLHEGHTALTWKIAYDETLAHFSPGAQLMLEAPHFLFADERISRIDSLATPNHPMVDPIWPGRMPVTTLVIAAGKSRWRGRIGIANHRTETRLREFAHRLRETVRPSTR